jgi:putative transposase
MISTPDRKRAISLIDEAVEAGARLKMACRTMGITKKTYKRWTDQRTPLDDRRPEADRPSPANKLTEEEEQKIIATMNSDEFKSSSPHYVIPTLLDRGIYIASESTYYRVLKKHKQQNHRGRSKKPENKPLATHSADGPNQVWMWDISWLPGPVKGLFFYLYLVTDLFSRKIVAWEVHLEESSEHAARMIRRASLKENLALNRKPLVLHSDNGSPMKGAALLDTLQRLGIVPSRSRPRVSNDNAYAEAIFRTIKYRPNYPFKGFATLSDARTWCQDLVTWYNHTHKHSGIKYLTPHQRHEGLGKEILAKRDAIYIAAKAAHPERWSGGTRDWSIEETVYLNPVNQTEIDDSTENSSAG